jgi:mannose-6-phosphate isomerase class I
MSFMFNPHPYDDPTAINKPAMSDETIQSVVAGTRKVGGYIGDLLIQKVKTTGANVVIALDGYVSAQWDQTINLIAQSLTLSDIQFECIDIASVLKDSAELDKQFEENLALDKEKDPIALYGKLFHGSFESLFEDQKLQALIAKLEALKTATGEKGTVTIVYGCGSTIKALRPLYDSILYLDVTPKRVVLRAKDGLFANLGKSISAPFRTLMRRCYYVDFEVTGRLRKELLDTNAIDFYIASDDVDNLKLIPQKSFNSIMSSLATYPMRCKPVYLEGVWGGHYITKLRKLPESMKNCAWVFDLIPLEVSIVVEAGKNNLEFPFFTFVQKEGEALMGAETVEKFGGYFPIRFNYDDTYHSSGNMSIQLHSGEEYNKEHYNEFGRQDESYYVVATGHDAKTYVGFNNDANPDEFVAEIKKSEKEFTEVDYQKYISHVDSKPGVQIMLPAGTIHSSGRNQVILEIGSLTVGSYTYKMYDYLRLDFDGKPRPIHSYHGERVLRKDANETWVKDTLAKEPELLKSGKGWAEYIVGKHDLLYYCMHRLEFEKSIEGDTEGKFHVLTLVDGEKVRVESLDNPELSYSPNYLDVIVVPANMGKYRIVNLGNHPVCIHKTMLKDGFVNDGISNN